MNYVVQEDLKPLLDSGHAIVIMTEDPVSSSQRVTRKQRTRVSERLSAHNLQAQTMYIYMALLLLLLV